MSQYPPPGYGPPPPGYGPPPSHPQATVVLVLGIVGLVACQVLSPFAWVMGNRVVREIDAAHGAVGGRDSANAGRICGIIGTVLLVVSLLVMVGIFVFGAALSIGSASGG